MIGYYDASTAQNAMRVVAGWIGENRKIKVAYHNGTSVDADIFNGTIRIPRIAAASGLTNETLNLLRGRVYHEAGHIAKTDLPKNIYPKGVLHRIWNSVEDVRMERKVGDEYPGCNKVFLWSSHYYNKKIAGDVASGKVNAPLWEALVAMMLRSNGLSPKWRLSEKAQSYYDVAGSTFISKVFKCGDSGDSLELAKEILDMLEDSLQEEEDSSDSDSSDSDSSDSEDDSDSSDSEDDSDSSDSSDSEDSDSDDSDSSDSEDDSDSSDSSDSDSSDSSDSEDSDSDDSDDSSEDSSGEDDSEDDSDSDDSSGENPSLKAHDLDDDGQDDGIEIPEIKTKEEIVAELENDVEGAVDLEDYQQADIEELIAGMNPDDLEYTSLKDNDVHISPDDHDSDRELFVERFDMVSAGVSAMTHALVQALRAKARNRKMSHKKLGGLDMRRLTAISKSLSKEVFFQTREGTTLDTAVELLIDESGSMGGWLQTQLLAIAIGESLDAIGVPNEITGHTSTDFESYPLDGFSRTVPMLYLHYKMFEENWQTVRHRIVNTSARYQNIDGEAVEWCSNRLLGRKESRRIVFSLSDGCPSAGQCNDHQTAANLMRVCKVSRERGVEVYGFGIGTAAPEKYYGKDHFIYLNSIEEMGETFIPNFVRIITGGMINVGRA